MIILREISLRRGDKLLMQEVDIAIQPGQKLALTGANGSGKSSLLMLLTGSLAPDHGEIEGLAGLRLAHMSQEVAGSDTAAGDFVLQGHPELAAILRDTARAEESGDFARAAALHTEMEQLDGYAATAKVQRMLDGLGFEPGSHERPVRSFSGGWRVRLNLARALFQPSDVLLLDEPTNHLDLDALLWLQRWLQQYDGTLVMISHDRDFIDAICQRVLHIEDGRLHSYRGNYSSFEEQRSARLEREQAQREKQARRVAEIEDFVRRFRAKASKARQAQSRLRELERMQRVAPAHMDSPFDFRFPEPERMSDPLLQLKAAAIGYPQRQVLSGVEITLHPGSRLGLLGRNGAGKSTLLKSITGALPLTAGERVAGEYCRIGYFDQQQTDVLDGEASPVLHLQRLDPGAREQDIRNFLGGFNFRGDAAEAPVEPFSGGEKVRLAVAMVVWQRPDLLVMDEPTNHLDLEMRHAMEVALQSYSGALVLVSHDRHLLRNTVEEFLLVHEGSVTPYEGTLEDYEKWTMERSAASAGRTPEPEFDDSKRARRRRAAALREELKPLRRRVEKLERDLETIQRELQAAQAELADPALYNDSAEKSRLARLMRREADLQEALQETETRWLEEQTSLESREAELAAAG